jgi:hypothetical protein
VERKCDNCLERIYGVCKGKGDGGICYNWEPKDLASKIV